MKKQAAYGDYIITINDDNSVAVSYQGEECSNAKKALREVSEKVGFDFDAGWTTRQYGSKLVDFLNSSIKSETPKTSKEAKTSNASSDNWQDEYDEVMEASDEFYVVQKNNKGGIADKTGKLLTPLKYEDFEFLDDYIKVACDELWGLVDKTGKEVIPLKYDDVLIGFDNGAAIVMKGDMMGFFGKNGKELIPTCLDRICTNEGVNYLALQDKKWGIVSLEGKWLVKPKFDDYENISRGYIKVFLDDKVGVLNPKGEVVVPVKFDQCGVLESERGGLVFTAHKNGKMSTFQDKGDTKEETTEEVCNNSADELSFSEQFAILAYYVANLDNEVQKDELQTIMMLAQKIDGLDGQVVMQRLMMERLGTSEYDIDDVMFSVREEHRDLMFRGLVMVAASDFHITKEKMNLLDVLPKAWELDEDCCSGFIQSWIMNLVQKNPDREFIIDED